MGTRVDTKGDPAHASTNSDHNPNSAGVVCAADFFANAGLDLASFAEHCKRVNHTAVKYVIYNRRIWSKARNGEGWRVYTGSNPHTSHVHVSVGVGRDGLSTGPYDDPTPWGWAIPSQHNGGKNMIGGLKQGDRGPGVVALQNMLNRAGFSPGKIDGIYGGQTSTAVLACRKSMGSKATQGSEITGDAYAQIHAAVAVRYAKQHAQSSKGGISLPLKVTLSGDLKEA